MHLTIRCRPELRRFCWLLLFLLLLATFRPRPPEVNRIVGGIFEDANHVERTQQGEHLDLCLAMSLLGAVGFISKFMCSSLVYSLAGWTYLLLGLCHRLVFRYTHAIRECKRERDIRLQHSTDIFYAPRVLQIASDTTENQSIFISKYENISGLSK